MAFMVDPSGGDGGGGGGTRPDVRAGRKVLGLAGMEWGTTQGGHPKWSVCYVVAHDPDGGMDVGALLWDTLVLTEKAAWKLRIVASSVGQTKPWQADDRQQMFDVLNKSLFCADISVVDNGRTDRDGRTKMDVEIDKRYPWPNDATDEQRQTVLAAQKWHREWLSKRSGGGSRSAGVTSAGEPSWGGGADADIPF